MDEQTLNALSHKELKDMVTERSLGTPDLRKYGTRQEYILLLTGKESEALGHFNQRKNLTLESESEEGELKLPTPTPKPAANLLQQGGQAADPLALIQAAMAAMVPKVDTAALLAEVREDLETLVKKHSQPIGVKLTVGDRTYTTPDRQHYKFPLLLACMNARIPTYLVGPAGTGKTSAVEEAAKALNLPYSAISFGPMTSKADLLGFIDANGNYRESQFVKRYREGGVFLGDEFDAGNAGVTTILNMALANCQMATPTGMLKRHADFVFVAGGNTYGTGADRLFCGRNQMDGATLDRFAFLDWPEDEGLEAALVGVGKPSPKLNLAKGGTATSEEWLAKCQATRKAITKLKLRHTCGMRAILNGATLLANGVGIDHVEELVIWKGLDPANREKVLAAIKEA